MRPEHDCVGPWIGSYNIGVQNGRMVRKKVSAKTRDEAAARLAELREQYQAA